MTFQTSRRGKKYLETAETLFRVGKTMTNSMIAAQLDALAREYQERALTASRVDAAKALARPAASAEQIG
jgi:hypothetical protein